MKKIGILLISQMLCFALFAQDVHYLLPEGTYRFEEELIYNFNELSIEEQGGRIGKEAAVSYVLGDYLSTHSMGVVSENDDFLHVIEVTYSNQEKYKVLLDDLIRENRNQELHDRINGIWVVAHTFDVLKVNNLGELLRYEPFWKTEWKTSIGEEWEDGYFPSFMIVADNYVYISSYATGYRFYIIQNDAKDDKCTCYTTERFVYGRAVAAKNDFMSKLEGKEKEEFCFEFDGDYLTLYIMENEKQEKLDTFIKVRNYEEYMEIEKQARSIAQGYKADLSKIAFPRHADGTCDYDDKIIKTHKAGGMYKTEDSLRLRAAEGIAGDALATLAAGSRVKVEAIGKEETIDGITANWVWVETLVGAMDKDGNTVETGTEGWLFGGYLSTTEYVEPVKEEKKLNLLDSVETKDERKVNRAVKMNKKEENDDFVFPFIQVGFGIILTIVLLPIILVIAKKKKAGKE